MIIYENLMGGMISSQFPYLVLIFAGWVFARLDLINKDGNVAFSKLSIEIFLPVYLFIQILRGTSADIISKNYLIIISEMFQMLIGILLALLYIWISKMDIRGRFSFIALACFNDIKKLHFLLTKTFCFHLKNQNAKEKEFCTNITDYGYCHLFFQSLFLWYIGEYLLRVESKKTKIVNKMYELKEEKEEDEGNQDQLNKLIVVDKNVGNNDGEQVNEQDKIIIKEVYDERLEGKPTSQVKITDSFYKKIEPVYMNLESTKISYKKNTIAKKVLYSLFRAPIIAMFTGFVVGFITPIRTWVLRTDSAVFLFYDTFNSIGNSHIICGLLVVGSNLFINEDEEYKHSPLKRKFTKWDYIAIISIKSFIMPFLGVIFTLIAYGFIADNRILLFTAFIQWLLPTTLDVISIVQAREINAKSMSIAVFIQWVIMTCLNNFIVLPAFLKGTGEVRAGSNLLDKPDISFPNYIGTPKYQKIIRNFEKDSLESKEIFVGKDCDKYKGILKFRYPIKNGVFNNEQDILTIFNHIYDKLKIVNKEEHPVFITEPILNPLYHRKQISSILFETLGVPAVFFGSQPILSLYSSNHKTGIVLESGEGITQCCVAFEGFAIPHSYIRYDFGGKNVTEYLQTLLRRCGHNFNTTSEFEIVKKIKEEMCYALLSSSSGDDRRPNESNETKYLLPDGNHVPIREEKVMAPEILFDPLRVGLENLSLPDMITTSISKVDIDIRNPLYKNIFLCGGNTMIKGVPERITNEIKKSAPKHTKIMLHAPASRKNSCFTGALIISNLGSFKGMWVTKDDYKEKGDKEIYIKTI